MFGGGDGGLKGGSQTLHHKGPLLLFPLANPVFCKILPAKLQLTSNHSAVIPFLLIKDIKQNGKEKPHSRNDLDLISGQSEVLTGMRQPVLPHWLDKTSSSNTKQLDFSLSPCDHILGRYSVSNKLLEIWKIVFTTLWPLHWESLDFIIGHPPLEIWFFIS